MAAANCVSAQSLVMRNQITANAIDTVHVPNRKYGHFGHSVSSVVWIGITISVFSANIAGHERASASSVTPLVGIIRFTSLISNEFL